MDFNETHISSATSLPHPLGGATLVELEGYYLMIGGITWVGQHPYQQGGEESDKILKYVNGDSQWTEMTYSLSKGKWNFPAIKVKQSIFKSCEQGNGK